MVLNDCVMRMITNISINLILPSFRNPKCENSTKSRPFPENYKAPCPLRLTFAGNLPL